MIVVAICDDEYMLMVRTHIVIWVWVVYVAAAAWVDNKVYKTV